MEPREIIAWSLAGLFGLLVLSSFTSYGTGLFGWGFMMGMMWLWLLLPLIVVAILVLALTDRSRGGQGKPRA